MGHRLLIQPDGKFAVFSTVTDSFLYYNLTEKQALRFADPGEIDQLKAGIDIYCGLGYTWEEAMAWARYGNNGWDRRAFLDRFSHLPPDEEDKASDKAFTEEIKRLRGLSHAEKMEEWAKAIQIITEA